MNYLTLDRIKWQLFPIKSQKKRPRKIPIKMKTQLTYCSNNLIVCLTSNRLITNRNMLKWKMLPFTSTTKIQMRVAKRNSFSKNEKWRIKHVWVVGTRKVSIIHLKGVRKCIKVFRNQGRSKMLKLWTTYISHRLAKVPPLMKSIRGKWTAIIWIIRNIWELTGQNRISLTSSKIKIWILLRKKIVTTSSNSITNETTHWIWNKLEWK